jgi:hypothetical protein
VRVVPEQYAKFVGVLGVLDGEETISKIAPEGAGSKEIGVDKIEFRPLPCESPTVFSPGSVTSSA